MIKINLDKAKQMAHEKRREARSMEFEPFDSIIMKQIPGYDFVEIESKRQEIRQKYENLQIQMDSATTAEELLKLLPKNTATV